MISASSSIASSFLSQYFGTSGSNSTSSGLGLNGSPSSPDYLLDGSLGSGDSSADFLSNALSAQDTEALLLNPHLNGAIGGTASANVQKIIQEIEGAEGISSPTSASAGSSNGSTSAGTSSASTTSSLPAGGVVA